MTESIIVIILCGCSDNIFVLYSGALYTFPATYIKSIQVLDFSKTTI